MPKGTYEGGIFKRLPPWLFRKVGNALMSAFGVQLDDVATALAEGESLRFPDATADHASALARIGQERRILRGPGETGETFAARLPSWWDAHARRGSAHALLGQMHAFFLFAGNPVIQYIANSGTTVTVAADGTTTRGTVAGWSGDGEHPLKWSRFFLVFYLSSTEFASSGLEDDLGSLFATDSGDSLGASASIYDLSTVDMETICSVPREWNAAHIDRIYIVLLPPDGIAWGLPSDLEWGEAGRTWGGDLAVTFTC